MFGKTPPGFDPTKPASEAPRSSGPVSEAALQAQAKIKTAIRFSAINVTPEGATAVGFTDSSDAKNPVHYYLKVGESRDGWLVKEADPVKATMTIARDDVEVALTIGGNSAQSDAASKGVVPGLTANRGPAGRRLGSPFASAPGMGAGTLRGRRLLREQQRQADEAAAAAKKAEENAQLEEARRRDEEEKAQRAAEREEQRAQLLQIQEELRKAREARAAREAEESAAADAEGE